MATMTALRLGMLWILLVLSGACASGPLPEPQAGLALADEAIAAGRPEDGFAMLDRYPEAVFVGTDHERYKMLRARSLLESGKPWRAYRILRDFTERHRFSPYFSEVEQIFFEAGRRMITSDWSFWIFANDKDDGNIILERFLEFFPRSRFKADALKLLGEKAYQQGDWKLSITRYTELRLQHPDSEWATLALFRVAMARYNALAGMLYDLNELRLTRNELQVFLANHQENPLFVAEATKALTTVRSWLGERHLWIAGFYRQIKNPEGERFHLEIADREYPETRSGIEAARRLAQWRQ